MAKPLANGFPIGAVLSSASVAQEIKVGDHGLLPHNSPEILEISDPGAQARHSEAIPWQLELLTTSSPASPPTKRSLK